MSFNFENLDKVTRGLMLEEFENDSSQGRLNYSKKFKAHGVSRYPELMREAISSGDPTQLGNDLLVRRCMNDDTANKNSHTLFAECEFNRYYMRACCRRAIAQGIEKVEVYRAKHVDNPRSNSLEGELFNPRVILEDLRDNNEGSTDCGLGKPNSGLSIRLPQ